MAIVSKSIMAPTKLVTESLLWRLREFYPLPTRREFDACETVYAVGIGGMGNQSAARARNTKCVGRLGEFRIDFFFLATSVGHERRGDPIYYVPFTHFPTCANHTHLICPNSKRAICPNTAKESIEGNYDQLSGHAYGFASS